MKVVVAAEPPADLTLVSPHHFPGDDDRRPAAAAPARHRVSLPERLLLRLLRIFALVGERSWPNLLHAILIHVVHMAGGGLIAIGAFQKAFDLLGQRGKFAVVMVVSGSGFFGLIYFLMWVSLVSCLVTGRRRCGQVFGVIESLLCRVAELPGHREAAKKLQRESGWLLLLALVMIVVPTFSTIYWVAGDEICSHSSSQCVIGICLGMSMVIFFIGVFLVPLKFVFAGLELLMGFRTTVTELGVMVQKKPLLNDATLRGLRTLYNDLSETFTSLTDAMGFELVAIMAYGTLSGIGIFIAVMQAVRSGDMTVSAPIILTYVFTTFMTLVLPCELAQQVLNAVGQTRCWLLKPQWQHPPQQALLQQELGLFRETVTRDLETLGDVGMFRLQRSTILSIMATVMTYVIVMVQFYITELTVPDDVNRKT